MAYDPAGDPPEDQPAGWVCFRGGRGCVPFDEPFTPPERDAYRESRTAHAVRSAGRPRRVLYTEGPDELPPPEPDGWCWCHDLPVCPDELPDGSR